MIRTLHLRQSAQRLMLVPSGYEPVGDGVLPDGAVARFYVDRRELDTLRTEGPQWKYDDARFIEEAVSEPDAIYQGLKRANQEDGYCYSVRPTRDPAENDDGWGEVLPPRFGEVFLAFARPVDMGYLVFDWEWRAEGEEPGTPEHWDGDFERLAWRRG